TGNTERVNHDKNTAIGADIIVRRSQSTYVEAEVARSKGASSSLTHSTDGGLTITEGSGTNGRSALGWRVGGQVDMKDVQRFGINSGKVGGYYEKKQDGFASMSERLSASRRVWGAHAALPITSTMEVGATLDDLKDGSGQTRRDTEVVGSWQFMPQWKIAAGVTHTKMHSPTAIAAGKSGY